MKISKAILTFVAPIATAMTIAPVITSCNKESFSFNYGDPINCYKKEGSFSNVDVHSLGIVQSTSKANAQRWTTAIVTSAELTEFASNVQNVYYDLVASLANVNAKPFALKWTVSSGKVSIIYQAENINKTLNNVTFTYDIGSTKVEEKEVIALKITDGSDTVEVQSYCFKGVTKYNS